jgi:hypothetical protein
VEDVDSKRVDGTQQHNGVLQHETHNAGLLCKYMWSACTGLDTSSHMVTTLWSFFFRYITTSKSVFFYTGPTEMNLHPPPPQQISIFPTSNPKTISTEGPLVVRLIHERLTKKASTASRERRRVTALKWNTQEISGLRSIWMGSAIKGMLSRSPPLPTGRPTLCLIYTCTYSYILDY